MKNKSIQIILVCVVVCFLVLNIGLLATNQQSKIELHRANLRLERLENVEFDFRLSKETTNLRFQYEQHNICIADIEQRFKNNYYGKKVVSFYQWN
jgi:hypothetical protein